MKLVLLNHFGETVALLLRESSFRKTQGTVISSLAAFLTQSQSPHLNFSLRWPLSDSSWLYVTGALDDTQVKVLKSKPG